MTVQLRRRRYGRRSGGGVLKPRVKQEPSDDLEFPGFHDKNDKNDDKNDGKSDDKSDEKSDEKKGDGENKATVKEEEVKIEERGYEMKFASLEIVAAAGELESSSRDDKFLIGLLQEDILRSTDPEAVVGVLWYDFDEESGVYVLNEEDVDALPAGSVICSLANFADVRVRGEHELISIHDDGFAYAQLKLEQQLQDDYNSDDDSQFGDDVVLRRTTHAKPDSQPKSKRRRRSSPARPTKRRRTSNTPRTPKSAKSSAKTPKSSAKSSLKRTVADTADPFSQATGKLADFDGDVERASKEVLRAVLSKDAAALKAALKSSKIHSLHAPRCVALPMPPLVAAMLHNDVPVFQALMAASPQPRAALQPCALPSLTTGKQTSRHASYNRRKINASRGGREGNNALLYDTIGSSYREHYTFHSSLPRSLHSFMPEHIQWDLPMDFDPIDPSLLDLAEASYSAQYTDPCVLESAMHAGDRTLAKRIIDTQINVPNAFNFLHQESLADTNQTPTNQTATTVANDIAMEDNTNKTEETAQETAEEKAEKEDHEKAENKDATQNNVAMKDNTDKPELKAEKETKEEAKENDTTEKTKGEELNDDTKPTPHPEKNDKTNGETTPTKTSPFSKEFQGRSIIKKAECRTRFTPLACACINPNPIFLETMLSVAPEHASTIDLRETTLLHYAAACEGTGPLSYLLDKHSAPKMSLNKDKLMPIHFAARAARPKNIQLLAKDLPPDQIKAMLTARSSNSFAAIHYAARTRRKDRYDTMRALLELGADPNLPSGASRNKVTPVHIAASLGDWDMLQLLLQYGGKLTKGDKLKRTPLIHACLNGHAHVVAKLLEEGVPLTCDSSQNYPVHYAAAYGWKECLELLVQFDDPDAKNAWKTSPLSVAIQKGRNHISAYLLQLNNVDINFKDEEGNTLFLRLVESFIASLLTNKDAALPWALEKLLDRNDLDIAAADPQGRTLLHLLCDQTYGRGAEERAVAFAERMLKRDKSFLDQVNDEGTPALFQAAMRGNSLLFRCLLEHGATLNASVDKDGKNIAHHLLGDRPHACQAQMEAIEKEGGEELLKEMLMMRDFEGYGPLHRAVLWMTQKPDQLVDAAHAYIKSLATRFPDLVTLTVGPTLLFRDAHQLATIVAEEEPEDQVPMYRRRAVARVTPSVVTQRRDASAIRKALKSRETVVPIDSEDVNKTLVHLVCTKDPFRMAQFLSWTIPLAKDVSSVGGRGNQMRSPLQSILYDVLPKSLLVGVGAQKRLEAILTCIRLLLDAGGGGGDVNEDVKSMFGDENHTLYASGGSLEVSEEEDKESVSELKRMAKIFLTSKENDLAKQLTSKFAHIMKRRELRMLASGKARQALNEPFVKVLASAGSAKVPPSVWDQIPGLDLTRVDAHSGKTALHVAISRRDQTLAAYLCQKCPSLVTTPSSSSELPIHVAAKMDDGTLLQLILKHLPNKDELNRGDDQGRSAFHFTVEKAATRTREDLDPTEIMLLRAGARVDLVDHRKRTPLHYCFLEKASSDDHFNFPHSLSNQSHDRVDLVSSLLGAQGASNSVNMADLFGRTPLSYAAAYNSTVSSLLLVSKGANLFHEDRDGNTPINIAVLRGFDNFVITLIKSVNKADLPKLAEVADVRRVWNDEKKRTKVVKRTNHSIVWHAIRANSTGLVHILLDTSFPMHTAAVDALSNESFQLARKLITTSPPEVVQYVDPTLGRTLLHEVAAVKTYKTKGWSTALASLLLESGVSPLGKDKGDRTALHIAAENGHVNLIRLLVNTDKTLTGMYDKDGHLPLGRFMRALPNLSMAEPKSLEILSLLTKGMESLSEESINKVPRLKRHAKTIDYSGVEFQSGPNTESVTKEIQERAKAKNSAVNTEDVLDGYSTLIIQALQANQLRLAQELIQQGALINMPDSHGLTPLHHAALSYNLTNTALLVRNHANVNVLSGDERKVTPLIVATFQCRDGHAKHSNASLELCQMLIRAGADVRPTCQQTGSTALHFAIRENNLPLARLIVRAALHAGTLETEDTPMLEKKQYLFRLGADVGYFPGSWADGKVSVRDPSFTSVPASLVVEAVESDALCLDSLEGLKKLRPKKPGSAVSNPNNAMPTTTVITGRFLRPSKPAKPSTLFGDSDDDDDDDEDSDEDSGDDSDDDVRGYPSPAQGSSGNNDISHLKKVYGHEHILIGEDDTNLSKPLPMGTTVLVQPTKEMHYANKHKMWLMGAVAKLHNNGTYDIDLYKGDVLSGVVRHSIRPWKSKNWPMQQDAKSCAQLKDLLSIKDKEGHTPLRAAVHPFEFGSYENVDMVNMLVDNGAEVDQDTLSLSRPGSQMRKLLQSFCKSEVSDGQELRDTWNTVETDELKPISKEQLKKDTEAALIGLEAKGLLRHQRSPPKINPVCELRGIGLRVLPKQEGDDSHYYDIVMAKVEMSHHGYSENKYYKMQIVEDTVKSLYVLVTNWGQIGDNYGQKQQTPFGSRDEAVAEFCKIFKSKSGNKWEDYEASRFTPLLAKYKPVKILASGYEKPRLPNIPAMLKDPDIQKTALSPDIADMMRVLVEPNAISQAATRLGLQQNQCPLGKLSVATLLAAEKKLSEIEEAIHVASKLNKIEVLQQKREALEKVATLSSQYYELLPTKEGDLALAPLDEASCKAQKGILLSLKELTTASEIVTAASHKAPEVNPLDYAFRALNAKIEVLPSDTPERIGVEQYFSNTITNKQLIINQVYKLGRNDEVSNKDLTNHRLLWHGTNVANMLGVIKEGLCVAPPTAAISGNAFGDGVYFADLASKSFAYCRAQFDDDAKEMPRAYLLLADVALGKQKMVSERHWREKPQESDSQYGSVWALGIEGPDVTKDIVFRTGTVFPLGNVIRSPTFKPTARWTAWRMRPYDHKLSEKLESVRNSPDSKFPVSFDWKVDEKPVRVTLENGPFCMEAKVDPVETKRKGKDKKKNSKKRKISDDAEENVTKGKEEENEQKNGENKDEDVEMSQEDAGFTQDDVGLSQEDEDDDTDDEDKEENEESGAKAETISIDSDSSDDNEVRQSFVLNRKEDGIGNHVNNSEFVVNDTNRINLKYIVEVTSRSWLEKKLRKKEAK